MPFESTLKKKNIKAGDRIRVKKGKKTFEGILVPITTASSADLILKLDTGYNMGITMKNASIQKVASGKKRLGKVGKQHLSLSFSKKKPPVSLVFAGGTISSRVDYHLGGIITSGDPQEFLHTVPELADIINLRSVVKSVDLMSEDLGHQEWITIAKAVHKELLSESRGVIVAHGTDTLHYTAAALSFFLKVNKPVLLVGSQKSSDRGGSDAGMNLLCAAHLALGDFAEVGTCMHGSMNDDACLFIRGTKVRKMHTIRRDAFRPINDLPIASITPKGDIRTLGPHEKRSRSPPSIDTKYEPKIALVKVYPSSDPSVLDYYRSQGYRGLVIEGTGLGHVPTNAKKSWIPAITKTVKDGIPVVITPQTLYGRVHSHAYTNLRHLYHEAGAIPGEDMLPETAYVKLGWVLGHTQDMDEVRKRMLTNVAGEITQRSVEKTFLY